MQLERVELTNFRCFKNESIELATYTACVGPNNSGKSTLLKAIDVFFRFTQKSNPLVVSDFNDPKAELRVILTFTRDARDLSFLWAFFVAGSQVAHA